MSVEAAGPPAHPSFDSAFGSALDDVEKRSSIGLIILLGSWTMLFGALLFSYASLRARSPVWPPPDVPTLSPLLPLINTIALLASSLALVFHRRAIAISLGAVFLAGQIFAWATLTAAGVTPSAGPYASAVFGLTWAHAAHALVGLIGLCLSDTRGWHIYWHYMAAVWLILFAALFLA